MNIIKRISIIFILFIIYTFVCAFSYAETVSSDISNTVFRLHIIANSDSKEDQDLKLLVRDNILDYMKQISSNASSFAKLILAYPFPSFPVIVLVPSCVGISSKPLIIFVLLNTFPE